MEPELHLGRHLSQTFRQEAGANIFEKSSEISPNVIVFQLDATLNKGGNFKRVRDIIQRITQRITAMHIPVAGLTQ